MCVGQGIFLTPLNLSCSSLFLSDGCAPKKKKKPRKTRTGLGYVPFITVQKNKTLPEELFMFLATISGKGGMHEEGKGKQCTPPNRKKKKKKKKNTTDRLPETRPGPNYYVCPPTYAVNPHTYYLPSPTQPKYDPLAAFPSSAM